MEDNLILEESNFQKPKRSQFLTVLCILSFVMCGLKLLTSAYSVYQNTPEAMQKSIEQVRAVDAEMADQMENNFIEMQSNTYLKLSPYFEIIYTLLSFMAVLMMWNFKKNGFYIYSVVEIIPYISLFFVYLIHGVDSFSLLKEINKQAQKNNRVIDCLLQLFIAQEETKFGLDFNEAAQLLNSIEFSEMKHISIKGFMAMASNTDNESQIRAEFKTLKEFSSQYPNYKILSFGMSSDYQLAIEEGSTLIRVGSSIFGERN